MQLAEILLKTMQELGKPDKNGDIALWRELNNDDYQIFIVDKRVLAQLDKVKDVQLQFVYKDEEKKDEQ